MNGRKLLTVPFSLTHLVIPSPLGSVPRPKAARRGMERPRVEEKGGEVGLRGALQSHPRSRGERVTQERRDQKGTEVNEERLNRESGCDGRGRECRVSLLTAFASFTSRTARREGNRMMNVEGEARQAKEGSKVGCISQPFTAPWFGCPLPAPVTVGPGPSFLGSLSSRFLSSCLVYSSHILHPLRPCGAGRRPVDGGRKRPT